MNKRIFNASLILSIGIIFIAYVSEFILTLLFVKDNAVLSIVIETGLFVTLAFLAVFFSLRTSKRVCGDITKSIDTVVIEGEHAKDVYPELDGLLRHLASQSRELETRIEKLSEEYERQDKIRREFTANVSHELKTPLTSINGFAQIISSGIAKADDIPQFAEKIAKESNRLMILIEDIMRLSNLDEGAPDEPQSKVSVSEIVSDALATLSEKALKRNISITSTGADLTVTANRTQLSELVYNIIDNAIKYNKDNGSVVITLSDKALSIADTGIGIPQEYTGRIFEIEQLKTASEVTTNE